MNNHRSRRLRAVPVLLSLGLVAAACSSSSSTTTTASGASATTSAAGTTIAGSAATTTAGTSGGATTAAGTAASGTTAGTTASTNAPATNAPATDADTKKRLTMVGTNGPQAMDPATSVVTCEAEQLRWVYDTLIRLKPDGTFAPGLAQSWESPDPSTFTLHLRKGVKFQDGTDFNATAVKDELVRAQTVKTSTQVGSLSAITSIDTPDDFTVTLHLKSPRAGILPSIFTGIAGMIPSPKAVAAAGDTYGANGAVGAGPWAFDKLTPTADLHVTTWDGYWDSADRYLAGIDMLGGASEFQTKRIESGELQYATMKDVQLPEAQAGKNAGDVDFKLTPTTQYAEIYINWTKAPFDNVLVRQALEYSLDRDLLAKSLTQGSATASSQPMPTNSWAYDKSLEGMYPYDPAKAKALLAQAGFPNGITVDVGAINYPYYTTLSQAVQDMVKDSGFTFNLVTVAPADINNRLYKLKDLPVAITAYSGNSDPGVTLEAKFSSTGNSNPAGTTVDGIDALLAKGAASVDQATRATSYQQVEDLVMKNALSIPVFHNGGLVAFTPKLKGVVKGYTTCQMGDFVSTPVYFQK